MNKNDKVWVIGHILPWLDRSNPEAITKAIKEINFPSPERGIIIGYSFIRTGQVIGTVYDEYGYIYEPGRLENITDHKVWVVEPLKLANRYLKPYRCFEHQIVGSELWIK